jgi:hypothetical protein
MTCAVLRRPMPRRHAQREQRLLNAVAPRFITACSDERAGWNTVLAFLTQRVEISEQVAE